MDEYFQELISRLGRRALYVDTNAIVGYFERGNDKFKQFIDKSGIGFRFVTSTYVLSETVRRLVKSNTPENFVGPNGEKTKRLSLYVLQKWLATHNVHVICVPSDIFDVARKAYGEKEQINCDLTDIISYTIVSGLQQRAILTDDSHFKYLGLSCLPE